MTPRVVSTSKIARKVVSTSKEARKVDPLLVEHALGAEPMGRARRGGVSVSNVNMIAVPALDARAKRLLDQKKEIIERARVMPEQKPGRSKQDYATPADFIAAVEERFGNIHFDLAADEHNAKAGDYWSEEDDSLSDACDWNEAAPGKILWLNPPFGGIGPWAEKCARYARNLPKKPHGRLLFLTPASVGANWYAQHVHEKAHVIFLNGRLSFDGKDPYPKDCMLSVFGEKPGFEVWRWK